MMTFPADGLIRNVIGVFERIGFRVKREGNPMALLREKEDALERK